MGFTLYDFNFYDLCSQKGPVPLWPNEDIWVQNPQFWSDFETVFFPVTVETPSFMHGGQNLFFEILKFFSSFFWSYNTQKIILRQKCQVPFFDLRPPSPTFWPFFGPNFTYEKTFLLKPKCCFLAYVYLWPATRDLRFKFEPNRSRNKEDMGKNVCTVVKCKIRGFKNAIFAIFEPIWLKFSPEPHFGPKRPG